MILENITLLYEHNTFVSFRLGLNSYTKVLFINVLMQQQPNTSSQRCSMKKGVLRNFVKFTGNPFLLNTSERLLLT